MSQTPKANQVFDLTTPKKIKNIKTTKDFVLNKRKMQFDEESDRMCTKSKCYQKAEDIIVEDSDAEEEMQLLKCMDKLEAEQKAEDIIVEDSDAEEEEEEMQLLKCMDKLEAEQGDDVLEPYTDEELNNITRVKRVIKLQQLKQHVPIAVNNFKKVNTKYGEKMVVEVLDSTAIIFLPSKFANLDLDRINCVQRALIYMGIDESSSHRQHKINFTRFF
jgi:hypothetical protein